MKDTSPCLLSEAILHFCIYGLEVDTNIYTCLPRSLKLFDTQGEITAKYIAHNDHMTLTLV
jgi:hypothetical protein